MRQFFILFDSEKPAFHLEGVLNNLFGAICLVG